MINENYNNRRSFVRVPFYQDVLCEKSFDVDTQKIVLLNEPIKITAGDISLGGIGAVSNVNIDPGKVLIFTYIIDSIRHDITVRVAYCIFDEFQYHLGLEFIYPKDDLIAHVKRLVARLSFGEKIEILYFLKRLEIVFFLINSSC